MIELDGSQHLEQQAYDSERALFLESKGYRVLRFWNHEVINNIEGVMLSILNALEGRQTMRLQEKVEAQRECYSSTLHWHAVHTCPGVRCQGVFLSIRGWCLRIAKVNALLMGSRRTHEA